MTDCDDRVLRAVTFEREQIGREMDALVARATRAEAERDALLDLMRGVRSQMRDGRKDSDWLTISNTECAIDSFLEKP